MSDDVIFQLADVLAVHGRVNPPGGRCFCGHEVPLGGRFTEHQVSAVLDSDPVRAMLDQARAEALREAAEDLSEPSLDRPVWNWLRARAAGVERGESS